MDDVILNKIGIIEHCLKRLHQEYKGHKHELDGNLTRQDAIVLNLLRICETSIDLGIRLLRLKKLGIPQGSRDVFALLEAAKMLPPEISRKMQLVVGFRNIAIHNYQPLDFTIVKSVLDANLAVFQDFVNALKK